MFNLAYCSLTVCCFEINNFTFGVSNLDTIPIKDMIFRTFKEDTICITSH